MYSKLINETSSFLSNLIIKGILHCVSQESYYGCRLVEYVNASRVIASTITIARDDIKEPYGFYL